MFQKKIIPTRDEWLEIFQDLAIMYPVEVSQKHRLKAFQMSKEERLISLVCPYLLAFGERTQLNGVTTQRPLPVQACENGPSIWHLPDALYPNERLILQFNMPFPVLSLYTYTRPTGPGIVFLEKEEKWWRPEEDYLLTLSPLGSDWLADLIFLFYKEKLLVPNFPRDTRAEESLSFIEQRLFWRKSRGIITFSLTLRVDGRKNIVLFPSHIPYFPGIRG